MLPGAGHKKWGATFTVICKSDSPGMLSWEHKKNPRSWLSRQFALAWKA